MRARPGPLERRRPRDLHLGLRRRRPGRQHERGPALRPPGQRHVREHERRRRDPDVDEPELLRHVRRPRRLGLGAGQHLLLQQRPLQPARARRLGLRRELGDQHVPGGQPARVHVGPPARAIRNRRRGVHQHLRDLRHAEHQRQSDRLVAVGRDACQRRLRDPGLGQRRHADVPRPNRTVHGAWKRPGVHLSGHHQLRHMDADRQHGRAVGRPRDRRDRPEQPEQHLRVEPRSRRAADGLLDRRRRELDERSRAGHADDRERRLPLPEHTRSLDQQRRRGHDVPGLRPAEPARLRLGQREHHHRGRQDSGIFLSVDGGANWSLVTDPSGVSKAHLPRPRDAYFDHEPVSQLSVYIGTQGRGVWRLAFQLPTARRAARTRRRRAPTSSSTPRAPPIRTAARSPTRGTSTTTGSTTTPPGRTRPSRWSARTASSPSA